MRLNFHGALREQYGDHADMAVETVADAIEGFSRQMTNWPREMRIAVVANDNHLDTLEKLRDNHEEVDLLPMVAGGSGKFTNIILGVAMVAAAFIPGVNAAVATSLIISGSLMIAQGVISMFLKAPKATSANDPEASKYLGINKNTTDVGTPMTMAWGLIDLGGQWLSLQSDSSNLTMGVFPVTPS